jgi:hypothetical protein
MIYEKMKKMQAQGNNNRVMKTREDYVLKVTGFRSYLVTGTKKLVDYEYSRKCIAKLERISLTFLEIQTSLTQDIVDCVNKKKNFDLYLKIFFFYSHIF